MAERLFQATAGRGEGKMKGLLMEAPAMSSLQNQDGYSPDSFPDIWTLCSQTTLIKQPLVSLIKAIPWGGVDSGDRIRKPGLGSRLFQPTIWVVGGK